MGIPHAQIVALHDALATVQLNAQALAAADLVIGSIIPVRDQFSSWSIDPSRRYAAQQLDDAVKDVQRYRAPMAGMPTEPVSPAAWDDLSHAIQRAYDVLWAVQDVQGDETEFQALLGFAKDVAVGSVQAMPGIIRDAVHLTSETATSLVGGVASGLLPLWPLVAVAGVLAVLGVVVLAAGRKRGLLK